MPKPHAPRMAIYRLYDATDVLLYVGISNRPESRALAHTRKHWGSHINYKTIEWLECGWRDALVLEVEAINRERPVYNIKQANWVAVQDRETGEITFAPNPRISEKDAASVSSRMTKSERDAARARLPEGEALHRYVRACVRALQHEPERALALVEEYWPVDSATVILAGSERIPTVADG